MATQVPAKLDWLPGPRDWALTRIMKRAFCLCIFIVLLSPAWANVGPEHRHLSRPDFVVTVGPGTVMSVHALDLPFSAQCYVVKYRTDAGKMIEIWHRGKLPLMQGMHGMLTYSSSPERILDFRVVQR
jgi:hypothetical protein